METFLYCWTDHKTNKLYVGSHKGTAEDGYICSGKYMLAEYTERLQDFSRQIIAHGSDQDIRVLERKILTSINAAQDLQFYNMHNANEKWSNSGIPHSENHKLKLRKNHRGMSGKHHNFETKEKIRIANKGQNNRLGETHTEAAKNKIRQSKYGNTSRLGKPHSEETKEKIRMAQKGRPLSKEHRHKLSLAAKKRWAKNNG